MESFSVRNLRNCVWNMYESVWKLGNCPHPPQKSSFKVNLISQGGRPSNINQIAAKLLINLSFFSTFCNWQIAHEGRWSPLTLTFWRFCPPIQVVSPVLWDCGWFYPSPWCSPLYRVLLSATISIMVTSALPYCSQRWLSKVVKIQHWGKDSMQHWGESNQQNHCRFILYKKRTLLNKVKESTIFWSQFVNKYETIVNIPGMPTH